MSKFCHLHVHTSYSILDGAGKIEDYVKRAKKLKMKALAITDHGNMAGVIDFYEKCKKEDIIPIIGTEAYFVNDITAKERSAYHIVLLAKNNKGFKNLLKLAKIACTEGFHYSARIDWAALKKHSEGLICLTACFKGLVSHHIIKEEHDKAEENLLRLSDMFGEDLYVETMPLDYEDQKFANRYLLSLATKHGIECVLTNDVHYVEDGDEEVQEVLVKIQRPDFDFNEKGLFLKSEEDMWETYTEGKHDKYYSLRKYKKALENTGRVAEKCKGLELKIGEHHLPKYDYKGDKIMLFKGLIAKGVQEKLKGKVKNIKEYKNRIKYEYKVIKEAGFIDYILIVYDILKWAREQKIFVGIGRGSVGGSLVAYLLGIHKVDPIEYDLLFERFINPVRCREGGQLPDIDTDFESEGRELVKQYIIDKYGADNVCNIGSYQRLKLKGAIKDITRIKKIGDYKEINDITKRIVGDTNTQTPHEILVDSCEKDKVLEEWVDDNKKVIDLAIRADSQIRGNTIHPAGMIIAPSDLSDWVPLQSQKTKGGERIITSQWEDTAVEKIGLLKLDVLGLKQSSVFKRIVDDIGLGDHENYDSFMDDIPLDDTKVFKMFAKGDTLGVFQCQGEGLTQLLRDMRVDNMEDIIASIALYRPGPLESEFHIKYCKRKEGSEDVEYDHADLEPALRKTYGIYVYQEQIMQGVQILGGFNAAEADIVRNAIGKKKQDVLPKYKKQFVDHASSKLGSVEEAEEIWDAWAAYSKYCFNKSHAAVYGVTAYYCNYFKKYYPAQFWAANISYADDGEKYSYRERAERSGIKFINPSVNIGKGEAYVSKKGKIVWGLNLIKGVGEKASESVMEAQPYESVKDFFKRVNKRKVNKKVMNNLILAGAFRKFGAKDEVLEQYYKLRKESLPKEFRGLSCKDWIKLEYGVLNFIPKPLKNIFDDFSDFIMTKAEYEKEDYNRPVTVGGIVSAIRNHRAANGDMAFIEIIDKNEKYNITMMADTWSGQKVEMWDIIEVMGVKQQYNGRESILASGVEIIED